MICEFLEDAGEPIDAEEWRLNKGSIRLIPHNRLLVGARKLLKTSIKQAFMIQLGLQNPNVRILNLLATQDNADDDLALIKDLFDHPTLRQLFPDIIPNESERKRLWKWSKRQMCLKRSEKFPEPTYTAAGLGKKLTSRHYNIIIPDDIVTAKLDNLTQDEIRPGPDDVSKAIGYHRVQMTGLLDNKPIHRGDPQVLYNSQIITLNNRWGDNDYVDFIEQNDDSFEEMVVPVIWPSDHPDMDKRNKPAWPEGPFGHLDDLKQLEKRTSTYIWNTQYLCNPVNPREQVFSKAWFLYYDQCPPPVNTVAFMDPALNRDKSQCYTAVVVVSQDEFGNWYVREAFREHMDTNRQLDVVFNICTSYPGQNFKTFGIEDVLFQEKIFDLIRRDPRYALLNQYGIMLVGEHPNRNEAKEQRIEALQPRFRNGSIYIKRNQKDLIQELTRFRRKSNSIRDIVDTLSYIPRMLFDPVGRRALNKLIVTEPNSISYESVMNELMNDVTNDLLDDILNDDLYGEDNGN